MYQRASRHFPCNSAQSSHFHVVMLSAYLHAQLQLDSSHAMLNVCVMSLKRRRSSCIIDAGFAVVKLATDRNTGEEFAVKIMALPEPNAKAGDNENTR